MTLTHCPSILLVDLKSKELQDIYVGCAMNEFPKDYYVRQKKDMMSEFERMVCVAKNVGQKRFDDETMRLLVERSTCEFEKLLPQLPYVGGKKSPFTALMIQSCQTLAFYLACKSIGIEVREFAQMMYETAEAYVDSISTLKKRLARWLLFSGYMKKHWRKWTTESQKRQYPGNWVGKFVEGDGRTFDYGLDFIECGWLKLLNRFGADEIAPYACLGDFAKMRGIDAGFMRTQTLAQGHSLCDFRFAGEYRTLRGWPPENLEEFRRH